MVREEKQMRRSILAVMVAFSVCTAVTSTRAAFIGKSGFGSGASVYTYDDAPFPVIPSGTVLGGATHTTTAGNFAGSSNYGATTAGTDGGAIYPSTPFQNTSDITFASPVDRAGIDVGLSVGISVTVEFYDGADALLDSSTFTLTPQVPTFTGYENLTGKINRIRIIDPNADGASPAFDNLTTEIVPEPSALGLCVAAAALFLRRRTAQRRVPRQA